VSELLPTTEAEFDEALAALTPDQLEADICKESFFEFFCAFWHTIEAVELKLNWHIRYLCDQLQEVYELWAAKRTQPDVLINVPPGTSKSTTVTQLFPAWLWVRQPSIRLISSSFNAALSISHSTKTRLCLKSPKFQRLYPGLVAFQDDQDGKTDYRNTALGQRYSTSTTGGPTGNHADFIIIDDPLNPQKAASEAALLSASDHLKTLATRTTDPERTVKIMVMQRISEKDPAGEWLASGRPLRHICLPGELTKDKQTGVVGKQVRPAYLKEEYVDGLLDPIRRPRHVLQGLKVALGSYAYAGQVQQLPAPDEGGILKKAWFRTITYADFLKLPGAASAIWHGDADTAYTDSQKNDPSALLISTYIGQTLYVSYVDEMWLEMPALKRRLPIDLATHNAATAQSKLYVEPKASGKSVVQELRDITQLNVVEAPTPDGDKRSRVNTASPFIEAGRVVLIDGSWNEKLINQAAAFPTAAHDDMLDCLTQAIRRHTATGGAPITHYQSFRPNA
jgi:predicted phage terminase large subunit-like protein